ncbi:MAG: hypothetical protein IJ695_10870 [Butyrivibrio sp.]|nr:hypothetical protein [Butyrivibrio sp.]
MRKILLHAKFLCITGALLLVTGCMAHPGAVESASVGDETQSGSAAPVMPLEEDIVDGEELLCLADSKEEAQKIADMYGIELVNFSYGVATFHADDPKSVINMGLEKGYPELELNGVMEMY